jgi:DNA-binding response OmpR family regulator
MPDPKHVLVAERDPEKLATLAGALRASGYATSEAGTGRDALRLVQMEKPDLVVAGLVLPDIGGRDLARILESNGDSDPVRTIVVTSAGAPADDPPTAEGAVERPIVRWTHVDEIVTLVNGMFDLSESTDPEKFLERLCRGDVTIDPAAMTVEIKGVPVELTSKEFRFLHILALNGERTCTREELRRLVWGKGTEVIGRTVDVLVSRLRSKLTTAAGREVVTTVRGIGYRFTG